MAQYLEQRFPVEVTTVNMDLPFYAQMYYSIPNEVSEQVPTAATNGQTRFFNPAFMAKQPPKVRKLVIIHEVAHDVLAHPLRRGTRDPKVWNIACDIVVNGLIERPKKEGGLGEKVPEGWVTRQEWAHLSEEEIYNRLLKDAAAGKPMPQTGMEDVMPFPGDAEEIREAAEKLKGNIMTAAQTAKRFGNLPAWVDEMVKEIMSPREKWYERLRRFFLSRAWHEYDHSRINRRELLRSGIIAPPLYSESMRLLGIAIDESGSIGQDLLEHFTAKVNDILLEVRPELTHLMHFDTQVAKVETFTVQDLPLTIRRAAGGGTSFVDVCRYAEEQEFDALMILTDMAGTFPEGCSVPVIWCRIDEGEAPFGEHVDIRIE